MARLTFSRRELYDLVWSKPLPALANELGVADWQIRQACSNHRVPIPGVGHWNKIAKGEPSKQRLFVEVNERGLSLIEINSLGDSLPIEPVVAARPSRRVTSWEDAFRQEKAERSAREKAAKASIPAGLHPLVQPTAFRLRANKPEQRGLIHATWDGCCGVVVAPGSVDRAIRLLDCLAVALTSARFTFEPRGKNTEISRGGHTTYIHLLERTRRSNHIATKQELADHHRRQAEYRRMLGRDVQEPSIWTRDYPQFDFTPTGRISVEVSGGGGEPLLDDPTANLAAFVARVVERVNAALESSRRWAEEQAAEQRRLDAERDAARRVKALREREELRQKFVLALLAEQDKLQALRSWLIAQPPSSPTGQSARMYQWVTRRVEHLAAQLNETGLDERIVQSGLFPKQDDD